MAKLAVFNTLTLFLDVFIEKWFFTCIPDGTTNQYLRKLFWLGYGKLMEACAKFDAMPAFVFELSKVEGNPF